MQRREAYRLAYIKTRSRLYDPAKLPNSKFPELEPRGQNAEQLIVSAYGVRHVPLRSATRIFLFFPNFPSEARSAATCVHHNRDSFTTDSIARVLFVFTIMSPPSAPEKPTKACM